MVEKVLTLVILSVLCALRVKIRLRHVDDEAHVEKHERRREEQTIQEIERAANSRKQIARVFYVGAALNNRFGQIAEDCGNPQQQPEHCRVCPVEDR